MVSARESRHPRWPVPAHALCALAGLLAFVLAAGSPAPAAAQDVRPAQSDHVLVGMAPNTGYEVTCDDSLLSLEPVPSNGLGIMEFVVDPRATGSPTKICVRVPAPPVLFGESTAGLTDTSVVVSWQTDRPARSRVEYGPTSGYGSTTETGDKLTLHHTFALNDLEPSTVYHYRLRSTDAFGNESTSGDLTIETLPPRPRITGLSVASVTDSTITLSWATTALCEARIEYGIGSSHEQSTPLVPGYAVKHEVTVEDLSPDTTYRLAAVGVDELGRTVRSVDITQTTDVPPLSVLSPAVVDTTMTTAIIGWSTTNPTRASVEYGPSEQYGWTVDSDTPDVTEHLAVLEGLTAGATYHYRITASDGYGQTVVTDDAVFSTKPEGTPEQLTIHKLAVEAVGPESVIVSWVTNLPATTVVTWGTTDAYGETWADTTLVTKHVVLLQDLEPATDYHASITSVTHEGTEASSGDFVFTSPPPDLAIVEPPVAVAGATDITVEWRTSVVATGWVEYGTTLDCAQSTEPSAEPSTDHAIVVDGLDSQTMYYLRAAAAVGAHVVRSDIMTVTTTPPVLGFHEVSVADTTATTATVRWSTSNPSLSYLRYGDSTSYGQVTGMNAVPSTDHSIVITGLSPEVGYHFQAVATDTFGQTESSEDHIFTTPDYADLGFRELAVYDIGPTFASVSWQTTHRATGVLRYGTSEAYTDSVVTTAMVSDHAVVLTGLTQGTLYHASARAVDKDGRVAVSDNITFVTAEYQDLSPPGTPEQLLVDSDSRAVVVSWAANPEPDLAGYRLYRRSESDTAAVLVDESPTYRTSYRDEDVIPGLTYEYAVAACDGSGNLSDRSPWIGTIAGQRGRLWTWPNPLRDAATIRLSLPQSGTRTPTSYALRIYDATGRLVRTLESGATTDAAVTAGWDGRDERNHPVSSGVYFCVAVYDGGGARGKLVVLR